MVKENYMIGLTDAQKRAIMCLDDIQDVCIMHKLNLTILDDGIGFVDPKDDKIVMVWRPQYKPAQAEPELKFRPTLPEAELKPTQKPSGGNMSAFIFGGSKGSGRFMGNKRKHTVRGMKRR